MKILLVNAEWLPVPPVLGGPVEETICETALSIRDPELTVISPWHPELSEIPDLRKDIFFHIDIDARLQTIRQILGELHPSVLEKPPSARLFAYLNGVAEHIARLDPDVIQVHNRAECVPFLIREFPDKKLILYLHNEPDYDDLEFRKEAPNIHRLVFVSHFLARRFKDRFPSCPAPSTVIHNSVNTNQWHPRLRQHPETERIRHKYGLTPGNTLLFIGRTVYHKGISFALDAMALLRKQLPHVKLIIAGSPFFKAARTDPFFAELQQRARALGDSVVFTGYVDHDQTPYLYAASDITVAPALWPEPFGKVIIESLASGVPVISSNRGAIPEIVDNKKEGILLEDPGDVKSLAYEIETLLQSDHRRLEMGKQARQKAIAHFASDIRLARVKNFYKHLQTHGASPQQTAPARKEVPAPFPRRPKTRVVLLVPDALPVPPIQGGAIESLAYETAMNIRDPETAVISPWHPDLHRVPNLQQDIFHHVDIDANLQTILQVLGDQASPELKTPQVARRFAYLNGVAEHIARLDPHIIHVHNRPAFIPFLKKEFHNKKLVLHMHNRFDESGFPIEDAIDAIDHLVFVSRFRARQFLSHYPQKTSCTTVIHNSINTDQWRPNLRRHPETRCIRRRYALPLENAILFIGRTVPGKGLQYLLKAMAPIRKAVPDAKLMVVGSPFFASKQTDPFLNAMKQSARALGDAVIFTGYLHRAKLPHIYAAANITVVPSVWDEGLPMVVIESMASGVPVIAASSGGIPELITDGVDGRLIEDPQKVEDLAQHIIDLLKQPEKRIEMGYAARRKIEKQFSNAIRFPQIQAFYQTLMTESCPSAYPHVFTEKDFKTRDQYKANYQFLAAQILKLLDFESVYDLGCANGFLLNAFQDRGKIVKGIETSSDVLRVLPQNLMPHVDIGDFVQATGKWDLVCCVEVAEHLPPQRSAELVQKLADLARKWIYFSAAPPGQSGKGHINCRPQTEWIAWFEKSGWTYDGQRTQALRKNLQSLNAAPWLKMNSLIFCAVD